MREECGGDYPLGFGGKLGRRSDIRLELSLYVRELVVSLIINYNSIGVYDCNQLEAAVAMHPSAFPSSDERRTDALYKHSAHFRSPSNFRFLVKF